MIDVNVSRDTADWILDIATAVGTVGAVAVAALSSLVSRADARSARGDAREARDDARVARFQAQQAQNRRDYQRSRAELTDLARTRAARQAAFIHLTPHWADANDPGWVHSAAAPLAPVGAIIQNNSTNDITDVEVQWWKNPLADAINGPEGPTVEHTVSLPRAKAEQGTGADFGVVDVTGLSHGGPLPIKVEFTDVHLDRWSLDSGGGLRLLNLRDIDVAEA